MGGVVMKGNEHLGADLGRKLRRLTVSAVTPPDTVTILVVRVLRIVDQQIGF